VPDGGFHFPALVLNADFRPLSYFPLSLWSWQDAIKAVFMDRVSVLSEYETEVRSPINGTVITKTFYYPRPAGAVRDSNSVARSYDQSADFVGHASRAAGLNLAKVRLIETRILVRREHGWEALPYVWNAAQSEAELARTGDAIPLELVADDGAREAFTYVVPNENQCAGCHVVDLKTKAIAPIGPKARHLNRDYRYAGGSENQLAHDGWRPQRPLRGTGLNVVRFGHGVSPVP